MTLVVLPPLCVATFRQGTYYSAKLWNAGGAGSGRRKYSQGCCTAKPGGAGRRARLRYALVVLATVVERRRLRWMSPLEAMSNPGWSRHACSNVCALALTDPT